MKTVWIVVKYWAGGRRDSVAAFFSEENARAAAGKMVGQDGAWIALETVSVQDIGAPDVREPVDKN